MDKKCPDCEKPYDSSMFKITTIADHWYAQCPEKHEYEVAKSGNNDFEYFTPKRPKPLKK